MKLEPDKYLTHWAWCEIAKNLTPDIGITIKNKGDENINIYTEHDDNHHIDAINIKVELEDDFHVLHIRNFSRALYYEFRYDTDDMDYFYPSLFSEDINNNYINIVNEHFNFDARYLTHRILRKVKFYAEENGNIGDIDYMGRDDSSYFKFLDLDRDYHSISLIHISRDLAGVARNLLDGENNLADIIVEMLSDGELNDYPVVNENGGTGFIYLEITDDETVKNQDIFNYNIYERQLPHLIASYVKDNQ